DPYDYWLGEYEDGLNKAVCDDFFGKVRACLVPLLKKVSSVPQVDDSFLWGDFPEEKQRKLSDYLMSVMGLDADHVGIAETEHPFTTSLGSHLDERITTHYHRNNFVSSMYSVIHEGGHALYDTGSREEYAFTVLDGGVSMGIHESQSRFYENIIGRSRAFCEFVFPKLCELFPELKAHTAEEFYRAVNKAEPSLVRTEADEVTYCLHVMVRYELEKRVMAGELAVHDLPAAWNALYKEYLGVDVPDDRQGVLQDSHWSGGSIGYFPSYALGSAYGAQFLLKMKETVDVDGCMKKGDFAPINAWNKEKIWQYGSLRKPGEILESVLGEPFDPNAYLEYLENKVKDVYGV
ncbi:MAG: carboxypeptidase M32, partial [Ruminococcus sp.]|nr:carboxypeptidase M32 [Candidatus Apopatosoma intestinale]